jgi:hypothetical protein
MRNARGNGHRAQGTSTAPEVATFAVNAEWLRQLVEGQAGIYGAVCNLTARQLRAQAELLEGYARGNDTPDLLDRQTRVIWSSWQDYADEAERVRKSWLEPLMNTLVPHAGGGKETSV